MATSSQPGFVDAARESVGDSAAVGAVAFVVNYVATYVFLTLDGVSTSDVANWKVAGWVTYNAHNVDVEISAGPMSQSVNYIEASSTLGSTVPKLAYYLLPAVVLAAAGYVVYQRAGRRLETGGAAGVGASIAGSYLVLAVLGTFLFAYSSGGATGAPKLTTAIVFAGIVYPVLLGAAGAVIAKETA